MAATETEIAQGYLLYSGDDDLPYSRTLSCGCCATSALYNLEATDGLPGYHERPAVLDSGAGYQEWEVPEAVKALLDANQDADYVTAYDDNGDAVATWVRTNGLDAI